MDYLTDFFDWAHLESWVIQVFLVVFATLLLNFFLKIFLQRLLKQVEKTHLYWDDALVEAMIPALTLLVWVLGLTFAGQIIYAETGTKLFSIVPRIREIGFIICLTWFLVRFIRYAEENIVRNSRIKDSGYDRTTADAIAKLLRISVFITSFLVILQSLGYSISGVLAFGGIGGVAVGFAARDLLANFFGGLMIYMDRPFSVGDWIRSPDRDIEGTVENIGWRLTVIRTFDKRPLYIPNSIFNTIALENPSRMSNRRIKETIGIRYDDVGKVEQITKDIEQMLRQHDAIDTDKTLFVNFEVFAASSLNILVYTFTKTTDWVKFQYIKQDVLLKIINIISKHGAECAFPTTTVHVPDGLSVESHAKDIKS